MGVMSTGWSALRHTRDAWRQILRQPLKLPARVKYWFVMEELPKAGPERAAAVTEWTLEGDIILQRRRPSSSFSAFRNSTSSLYHFGLLWLLDHYSIKFALFLDATIGRVP